METQKAEEKRINYAYLLISCISHSSLVRRGDPKPLTLACRKIKIEAIIDFEGRLRMLRAQKSGVTSEDKVIKLSVAGQLALYNNSSLLRIECRGTAIAKRTY